MIKKTIKVDRNQTITVGGLKKTVHVVAEKEIDWPETIDEAVQLFGDEKTVLEKIQEIYRIRQQDKLARQKALEIVAPERALLKEKAEQVNKLAKLILEKGLSIEQLEKIINKKSKK